jgi:3-phosphoshikimate 1-carboxyvinyltransferase
MSTVADRILALDLPPQLAIEPAAGPIDADVAVPGSKSLTNRYLVMGALADGDVSLTGILDADDSRRMVAGLEALGFTIAVDWDARTCRVAGRGGVVPAAGGDIFVGAAGTVMRFLAAFVTLGRGRFRLDGTPRMRERPIEDLLEGLRLMGVNARSEFGNGCPPVIIEASGLPGGKTAVDASRSSQYLSAMLMVAPYARALMPVSVSGTMVSRPFVDLTLRAMADFGVLVDTTTPDVYVPTHGARYRAGQYEVEGDATAASYFLAAAAILGGRCAVTNVGGNSPQGDAGFADLLWKMGCQVRKCFIAGQRGIEITRDRKVPLKPIDADLNDMPDVVLTLAAVCMFAEGTSTILNVGNLRIKETDRLAALSTELRKLGAQVEVGEDYLEITPGRPQPAAVDTYDDHRMAMAMALVGLGRLGVVINDPGCVAKTYPEYFRDLRRIQQSAARK